MTGHLITTTVEPSTCRTCRAPVLRGIAEGLPVEVDPEPIEPGLPEVAILATGAWTFTLNSQKRLIHRSSWRIGSRLLTGTIHAQHPCTVRRPA